MNNGISLPGGEDRSHDTEAKSVVQVLMDDGRTLLARATAAQAEQLAAWI